MIGVIAILRSATVAVIAVAAGSPAFAELTVVRLKPAARVDREVVVLGDVADVLVDSPAIERRLKELDLLDRENSGSQEVISARHVQIRLLLDGFSRKSIMLLGAEECRVSFGPPEVVQASAEQSSPLQGLLQQASSALAKAWLTTPDDIEVQIVSPPSDQKGPVPGAVPELELPSRVEPGRIQAQVRWVTPGRIERTDQISLEARLRQTVVLAAHAIPRGAPLRPGDVVEDRRLLSTRVEQLSSEQVIGYVARRGLNQGEQVSVKDLAAPKARPVIQARSGVRVVARKGRLSVTLQMAEALEAGNVGEVIRLRNLQSGQIIMGRVVSSQEVEIPLD